ncbi:MAG: nucleotide exchange factor GrpE [Anaerovoracaceae bacterium]|nr:nucleotide exchange factor GrpE [Anaerovoracaceae bacterium]
MTKQTEADAKEELREEQAEAQQKEDEAEEAENGAEAEAESSEETAGAPKENKEEEEELQTRYLRLAADFQNYRRRFEKEKSDIYARANEKIVTELLDVIDNFERALAAGSDCGGNGFVEGMEMIFKQFKGVLEKSGLKEIQAEGEPFDPNFHHAVLMEADSEKESGTVTEVLQKGYLLNDRVIRPSMVKVAE